jgi:hypothetical protein
MAPIIYGNCLLTCSSHGDIQLQISLSHTHIHSHDSFPCLFGSTSLPGATTCNCSPGYYKDVMTLGLSCQACPPDSYSSEVDSLACTPCTLGVAGFYKISPCTSRYDTVLAPCQSGYISSTNDVSYLACSPCPPQTYSSKNRTVCLPCNDGQIAPEGSSSCFDCPQGTYAVNNTCVTCEASYSCSLGRRLPCAPNSFSNPGQGYCTKCNPGFECTTSYVRECPAGTFNNGSSLVCVACKSGEVSDVGASYCTACPSGYTCLNVTEKIPCQRGSYCPVATQVELPCVAGYVCESPDKQEKCGAGTLCPPGSSVVTQCPEGIINV